MTGRELVEAALNHQKTERLPIDFGGRVSGISAMVYGKVLERMGMPGRHFDILDSRLMLAKIDEDIMERLHVDTRYICQKAPVTWDPHWNEDHSRYIDEWGVTLGRPTGGNYYDYVDYPLKEIEEVEELEEHKWPDVSDLSRNEGILEEVRALAEAKDPFFLTSFKGTFEQAWSLRGMENMMMDIYINPELFIGLMEKVLQVQMQLYGPFLEQLAPYLGLVCFTDDVGGQHSLMISRKTYQEFIYPFHKRLIAFIREKCPNAKVSYHCCGSIVDILDDIVALGVDVLNPVQTSATGMDIHYLKEKYGDKLSFWGGIDTQHLLSFADCDTVRAAIREVQTVLGAGGGYLYAPCHCIQANTPVENIMALFE